MADQRDMQLDLEAQTSHGDTADGQLHDLVQTISNQDAQSRYEIERANSGVPSTQDTPSERSVQLERVKTLVSWDEKDLGNPHNFSSGRKYWITSITMFSIINSTMGSSLPSNAVPYIAKEFHVTSQAQMVLPISCYLIGYVLGPIVWGPMSEHVGRRSLSIAAFVFFALATLACALSPNWPALLIFRFFCGASGSAPIAVVTGILADIYPDPVQRGRALAFFMATTVFGPLLAPIISGYCSTSIGWRWTFWIGLIYAGASVILVFFLPETYAPILLSRRAAKIRKADPNAEAYAAAELEPRDLKQLVTVVLTRPLRMIATESIVTFTCLYLSLVYAIFYMSFQAYPLIFQDVYGLSPGLSGCCYLAIGVGALLSLPVFWAYDWYLARARERGDRWTRKEESRRLPLATLGGPLFVISLFWLGWSSKGPSFVAPMLAGIPFGMGFMLIFMAMLNYITDAYEIFAASANAAASSCRSVFAVVLPFAAKPMFSRLGIPGACSLLGGLSAIMCIIPFVFLWKGEQIRAGSKFCIALKERKAEMERKNEEQRLRREARAAATAAQEAASDEKATDKMGAQGGVLEGPTEKEVSA